MRTPASRCCRLSLVFLLPLVLLVSTGIAAASSEALLPEAVLFNQATSFGRSVAVSGGTAAVGVPGGGYVLIFQRNPGGANPWVQVAQIAADNSPQPGFGYDVALSGDLLVAGFFDPNFISGSVYVFERNRGGTNAWGQLARLTPSVPADASRFGASVAISGDTVVIGSGRFSPPAVSQAAYVFKRNQGGADHWGEVRRLTPADPADLFGSSVAIHGDRVVVGAPWDDDQAYHTGAAYIFERNQGGTEQWGQVRKLTASNASGSQHFGTEVGISGGTIVVGTDAGFALIFERDQGGAGSWGEVRRLISTLGGVTFGDLVAIDGDRVLVGSRDAFGEFRGEAASDGRDVHPDLLEDLAGHLAPHSATTRLTG